LIFRNELPSLNVAKAFLKLGEKRVLGTSKGMCNWLDTLVHPCTDRKTREKQGSRVEGKKSKDWVRSGDGAADSPERLGGTDIPT